MSKFQLVFFGVLIAIALVAFLIFSGVLPGLNTGGKSTGFVNLTMWGNVPEQNFRTFLEEINDANEQDFKINYVEKKSETYENDLVNALASGSGPDLWLINNDEILKNKDRIVLIPYTSLTQRDFKDTFIDQANILLTLNGYIGLPLIVDPIVLYWNKDMFSSAGIAKPPQYWDEFVVDVPLLTIKDNAGNITQSGTALGDFKNVKNAKDIISMLILQTGNNIIDQNTHEVILDEKTASGLSSAESAVRFFIEFSNSSKESYSWNRSLTNSSTAFTNASLAMYFGYASEINDIRTKNPHLNFDVAVVPQIRDGAIKATFGKMQTVVISKSALNQAAAINAVFKMAEPVALKTFSDTYFLMPSLRSILSQGNADPSLAVFYKSAIQTRSWLEPNPQDTSLIFKDMIESSITGKVKISDAVRTAQAKLEKLFKNYPQN